MIRLVRNTHPTGEFQEKLFFLKIKLDACNTAHGRTGLSALKGAVTEMNITFENPTPDQLSLAGVDEWGSVGATSFLAGQYWAEAMSVGMKNALQFMTFWSVKERDNLGYIKSDSGGPDDGRKLSTYYHFQMMAKQLPWSIRSWNRFHQRRGCTRSQSIRIQKCESNRRHDSKPINVR